MLAIADLSFGATTEAHDPRWDLEQAPGIPPQHALTDTAETTAARHPGGRSSGQVVVLHRGFYPGFAFGELLLLWQPDGYQVLEGCLPDFVAHGPSQFNPLEPYKAHVASEIDLRRCVVMEIVADTITGPTYRLRPVRGRELSCSYRHPFFMPDWPWQKLEARAIRLWVNSELQSALERVTGIRYRVPGEQPTQRTQPAREPRKPQRRPHKPWRQRAINTWAAWHVELESALEAV